MLARFSIIAAIDDDHGIGKDGKIPWNNKDDQLYFRRRTLFHTVIMGRKTYQSLPNGPLKDRRNVVISKNKIDNVETVPSLFEALKLTSDDTVMIIGGQQVYKEAIEKYSYLCNFIWITIIDGRHECDTFFPFVEAVNLPHKNIFHTELVPQSLKDKVISLDMQVKHPEQQYLDLLQLVLKEPFFRKDRTGVGIKSIFGKSMEFDLTKGFPLFTTKKVWFSGIKKELLFFISGCTDTKLLEKQGVNIWHGNTTKQFLTDHNLPWQEGDMGPMYPFQWRHAGQNYQGCDKVYAGIDQLQNVIDSLTKDPFSRRHIISSWDVANIDKMVLPPCHCFIQFYVGCNMDELPTFLDAAVYQRSADMFLGVPFNIASYALLMHIVGHLTKLRPRNLVYNFGDVHVYSNHVEQVTEQIKRTPYPFPTLRIKRDITNIDDFTIDDFELVDYRAWASLQGEMAI